MLFLNLFPVYQNIWWVLPCKRGGTVLYIRIFGGCCLVREWATVLYIRIFGDTDFKLFMFMLWHELLPLDLDNGFREIYKYYLCIVYFLMNMYFGWHTKFCLLNNRKYFTLWFYWSQNFRLFVFPIFRFWAYLMKVIPETCRAH